MARQEKEKEENQEEVESKKGLGGLGKKKILVAALLVVVILFGGAFAAARAGLVEGAWTEFLGNGTGNEADGPLYTYSMPDMQATLDSEGSQVRYVSVKFSLGHNDPKLEAEIDKRLPELRDRVLSILWEKSVDELNDAGGKEALRKELLEGLNEKLTSGELQGIYFSHFMLQ